jgi:hypothetical protein
MRYPPGIIPGAGFYEDSTDAADGFLAGLEEVSIALKLLDKTYSNEKNILHNTLKLPKFFFQIELGAFQQ